jgi:hypothetical protein
MLRQRHQPWTRQRLTSTALGVRPPRTVPGSLRRGSSSSARSRSPCAAQRSQADRSVSRGLAAPLARPGPVRWCALSREHARQLSHISTADLATIAKCPRPAQQLPALSGLGGDPIQTRNRPNTQTPPKRMPAWYRWCPTRSRAAMRRSKQSAWRGSTTSMGSGFVECDGATGGGVTFPRFGGHLTAGVERPSQGGSSAEN